MKFPIVKYSREVAILSRIILISRTSSSTNNSQRKTSDREHLSALKTLHPKILMRPGDKTENGKQKIGIAKRNQDRKYTETENRKENKTNRNKNKHRFACIMKYLEFNNNQHLSVLVKQQFGRSK